MRSAQYRTVRRLRKPQTITRQFGQSGDKPVPGDYDGDGVTDFATVSTGANFYWNILQSASQTVRQQSYGLTGDTVTPADYDGDGKMDISVYRPAEGNWYVIPSSNPGNPYWVTWGLPGDIPVFPAPTASAPPFVKLRNVTHPNISPVFQVGDTLQVVVTGPPNQAVYRSQAQSGISQSSQIGQTDIAGYFRLSTIETGASVGRDVTVTEVYSVGAAQASPSLSYLVTQTGNGTVATGERGQTPDGHLSAMSYLSVSNGSLLTYSTTYLDFQASALYDVQTVAKLYQDGIPVQQSTTPISYAGADVYFSGPATPWSDYNLQSDHYAVAFLFLSTSFFYNPFSFGGGSCFYASSDCSVGIGSGPVLVLAASIYVGSTLADQTYIPHDGTPPPLVDDSFYNDFISGILPSERSTNGNFFGGGIWKKAVLASFFAAIAAESFQSDSHPPIPFEMELVTDAYIPYRPPGAAAGASAQRFMTYLIKDIDGRAWVDRNPLTIYESFTFQGGAKESMPQPNNPNYRNRFNQPNPGWSLELGTIAYHSFPPGKAGDQMTDDHRIENPGLPNVYFNQYYWATKFSLPAGVILPPLIGIPDVASTYQGRSMPMIVNAPRAVAKCKSGMFSNFGVGLGFKFVGINGDITATTANNSACMPPLPR